MGCLSSRSNEGIRKSIVTQSGQKTFYEMLGYPDIIQLSESQYRIIEVQGRVYLLYWKHQNVNIVDHWTCNVNIVDPQTRQSYEILLRLLLRDEICSVTGYQKYILIRTYQFLYILQRVEDRFKIVRQIIFRLRKCYKEKKILFISMDFFLLRQNSYIYLIKLGAIGKLKIIFKFYIQIDDNNMYYDSQQGAVFLGDFNNLYILDIKSKLCRQIKLRPPRSSLNINLKYVKLVDNNIDVLFYVEKMGLFLNKINYQDGKIQSFRFIYSHVLSCDICEDNDQLVFYTANMFMTLDKDYNIKQKYGLNHYQIYSGGQKLNISIRKIIKSYLFLHASNQQKPFQIRIYKKIQNMNEGRMWMWMQEIKDYEVENVVNAEISQNQLYLAILKQSSLIFYIIEPKIEFQYFFSEGLMYYSFSSDSRHLCLTSFKGIIYFKCQQGLKQKYQLFYKLQEKLIFGRNGINISRDSKNRIIVFSQSARKIIFSKQLSSWGCDLMIYGYCPFSGIIMISETFGKQFHLIYKIHDRKQIKLDQKESNCILEQKTKELMSDKRLEIHCRQGSPDSFVLQNQKIFVLDKNQIVIEEISYDPLDLIPIQVMDNYILCKNHKGIQLIRRT